MVKIIKLTVLQSRRHNNTHQHHQQENTMLKKTNINLININNYKNIKISLTYIYSDYNCIYTCCTNNINRRSKFYNIVTRIVNLKLVVCGGDGV